MLLQLLKCQIQTHADLASHQRSQIMFYILSQNPDHHHHHHSAALRRSWALLPVLSREWGHKPRRTGFGWSDQYRLLGGISSDFTLVAFQTAIRCSDHYCVCGLLSQFARSGIEFAGQRCRPEGFNTFGCKPWLSGLTQIPFADPQPGGLPSCGFYMMQEGRRKFMSCRHFLVRGKNPVLLREGTSNLVFPFYCFLSISPHRGHC